MKGVQSLVLGLVLGISVLFASYVVGTANNVDMNQMSIAAVHNVVGMV